MIDLSSFFVKYHDEIKLPYDKKREIREKKKINVDRLKTGLNEYNEENNTNYKIDLVIEQGSIAMNTAIVSDYDDFDIDVAVIMPKYSIKELSCVQIRHVILRCFEQWKHLFSEEPKCKTNCVRIKYQDGYHLDLAVYRNGSIYEHAGAQWTERNPYAINGWFSSECALKGDNFIKVVRLMKRFTKSRKSWKMPGGLIVSVLCSECYQNNDRLDFAFYYTAKKIIKRLNECDEVKNPCNGCSLLLNEEHYSKIRKFKQRLETKINRVSDAYNDNKHNKIVKAYRALFNDDNFGELIEEKNERKDNEMFIDDMYEMLGFQKYNLKIIAEASYSGGLWKNVVDFFGVKKRICYKVKLKFTAVTNAPKNRVKLLWKVRNVGYEAIKRNQIRGSIGNQDQYIINETANFYGDHYVECYLIENNVVVATAHQDVKIDNLD